MSALLLDVLYLAFGLPILLFKVIAVPRFRAGWRERLGGVPELPRRHRIWVHCASVGEVLLARSIVDELASRYPESEIVVSTQTSTGREAAAAHMAGRRVFYFPLDFSPVVRRVLGRVKPSAVLLVELELWPNFLTAAWRARVPVVVVNGRITERSYRRYGRFGALARSMFARVEHYAVQSEEYAVRFERLGVPRDRITVAGTTKYDAAVTEVPAEVAAGYRDRLRLGQDEDVLVGGCTHPGEDELLIDYAKSRQAARRPLRLILAPRHRENVEAVEKLVRAAGFVPVRKTTIDTGAAPEGFETRPHVILVDTTGELGRLYAVATVAFVGGSMVRHGGQNMLEPAALGVATVFGPHTWNFAEPVEMLVSGGGAVQIHRPNLLGHVLDGLFGNPARRAELGARARLLIERQKGATQRNVEAIRPFLERSA